MKDQIIVLTEDVYVKMDDGFYNPKEVTIKFPFGSTGIIIGDKFVNGTIEVRLSKVSHLPTYSVCHIDTSISADKFRLNNLA